MPDQTRPIYLSTDCKCGHTYNWHIPGDVCQAANCACKQMQPSDDD